MPRHAGAPRRHPVLRRTRILLRCQLATGGMGVAAVAAVLTLGGSVRIAGGWWPALGPVVTTAAAAALLVYLRFAERPRRAVLIAVLLLPAIAYVADAALSPLGAGTGIRSGSFGWFAYASSAAAMRLVEVLAQILTAGLWATTLARLVSVANAVLLILPASREAFGPAAPPDQPDG